MALAHHGRVQGQRGARDVREGGSRPHPRIQGPQTLACPTACLPTRVPSCVPTTDKEQGLSLNKGPSRLTVTSLAQGMLDSPVPFYHQNDLTSIPTTQPAWLQRVAPEARVHQV